MARLTDFHRQHPARPSSRHEKLIRREVFNTDVAKPSYLKWSEVPITFDREDHPDHVPQPGSYPLVELPYSSPKGSSRS
jgi:hypothetical protein